jgi:hypothetical protein
MSPDDKVLATLVAKEEIRDLALLYCRAVDRKDVELLRTLYTRDGTDDHGAGFYQGSAAGFVDKVEASFPRFRYTGHHICNHLISVNGDEAEGEIYALACHVLVDGKGGFHEDVTALRYADRYCKEDGRWRFAQRVVSYDLKMVHPVPNAEGPAPDPTTDASYATLASRLFARGPRA